MKNYLKKFNYPKIHTLDDVAIADIFHKSNRQFLVGWLLKNINPNYNWVVDSATKEELAEILHCNGFCTNLEKMKFIDGELEANTQLVIITRIFKHLDNVFEARNNDDCRRYSVEELKHFTSFDTNLFPVYGSQLVLSPTQRQNKILEYKKEIEQLQNLIKSKASNEVHSSVQFDSNLVENLSNAMNSLEISLPNFQRNVFEISNKDEEMQTQHVNFKEDFGKTLQTCNENNTEVLELIRNINEILNFKKETVGINVDLNGNRRNGFFIRQLSESCSDVIDTSRRIF